MTKNILLWPLIFALLASPAVGQDYVLATCTTHPESCSSGTTTQDNCAMSGPPNFACCAANGPECWECEREAELAYQEWLQCGVSTALGKPLAQEPSRDSQLIDFFRLRIANLERQVQVYEANDAEQQKIIASQAETIKAWEDRSSGKMTKKDWILIGATLLAGFGTVVGR